MNEVLVQIKWGSKEYTTSVTEETTCKAFMNTLVDMTGVPTENMKILGFGRVMKPTDKTLGESGLKPNHKVMMIGHLPSKAVWASAGPETRFVEDLTKEERMKLFNESDKKPLPLGITNLGVTCYMNSCIQAIRAITPVRDGIVEFVQKHGRTGVGIINKESITKDIGQLLIDLEGGVETPTPQKLIASMRQKYPELARRSKEGHGYMQQDVDEFWGYLTDILEGVDFPDGKNPLKDAFEFEMRTTSSLDSEAEGQEAIDCSAVPASSSIETSYKLRAFMGSAVKPVSQLRAAMDLSMTSELTKRVAELGDSEFKFRCISKLVTLPKFLDVHLVRFEWKKNDDGGNRAKVTRRIAFSNKLDLFDYCDEELQASLRPARNADALDIGPSEPKADGDIDMEEDKMVTYPDGTYSLVAIITHQGRDADSGHYLCWRKKYINESPADKKEANLWIKFDDDKVAEQPWDTLDLLGGRGDHHIAYLTFWKKNMVTVKESLYNQEKIAMEERRAKMLEVLAKKNEPTPEDHSIAEE